MPSDCRGDGFDIALRARADESGDYRVRSMLCRVSCAIKIGSRNWHSGIPAGYTLAVDPAVPYRLRRGERAEVCVRHGRTIGGNGYMHRVCASVAILDAAGRQVQRGTDGGGHTPYWIESTSTFAAHYSSGMSRSDEAAFDAECKRLESVAAQINATATLLPDNAESPYNREW